MNRDSMLELLHAALASPRGIRVTTGDPQAFKSLFEAERERAAKTSPGLYILFLRSSPTNPNELWIVKGEADAPRQN